MRINGKPVIDATEPLHISISKDDARRGRSKDPGKCAAAQCLLRTVADAKAARVHLGRVYIELDSYWVRYMTPPPLKLEIVSFDRGANAQYTCGDYTLPAPKKTQRLENGAGYREKRRKAAQRRGESIRRTGNHQRRPHIARIHHQIEGVRPRGANR